MTQEGAEVALTNLCDTTGWGDWHSNFRIERRIVGRREHDSPAADTAHGMPTELEGLPDSLKRSRRLGYSLKA